MQFRNSKARYGVIAQTLHWVITLGFVAQYAIAWYAEGVQAMQLQFTLYNLHKSIGVTILALAVVRIVWRLMNPVPPMPSGSQRWEELASRASHVLLYALLFAQPITGLAFSMASSFPTVIWGYTLPDAGNSEALKDAFNAVHVYLGWATLGLVGLHVVAALRHHFVLKDNVLRRMLPFVANKNTTGIRRPVG
ncbi:cytochrome b [Rhodovibrio salinarum]|uniref:Cytochrome b n=1 Tax=Rhodovibrio salinarum TaxID=1087 RepID=A0A934QGZ7_9PROT|nr:cytochrome b [Rhodovibrio salinarum]MBK1696709.1 cytochrome b [Rhodovibrio salinarum]